MQLQGLLTALAFITTITAQQFFNNAPQFNPWEGLKLLQPFPTQAPYYTDYYKRQGYETDEKGNVWTGNDAAKFMIFARSSYP
ncbi:hypothetical protein GCK32_022412 [Trichostrongylus colubriformis]|uniref:Uncharacterized protein n=1 Tax=Trichostrongylus colubriformis TaxID=6319 RepID=A0AAN8I9D7_TRICO